MDAGAAQNTENERGSWKSPFKPISIDGANAKARKCNIGYQYQCWVHKAMPIHALGRIKPSRELKEMEQLRPPASTIPAAIIAPSFVNVEG